MRGVSQRVAQSWNPRLLLAVADGISRHRKAGRMYLARFSYDFAPSDRDRALACIRREVDAAAEQGLNTRLLVPLTRPPGGAALQFEVEVDSLDQLERLRHEAVGASQQATGEWVRELTELLTNPPEVQIFRIAATELTAAAQRPERRGETGAALHPAGQHARPSQTGNDATPGVGALSDAGQRSVEARTG